MKPTLLFFIILSVLCTTTEAIDFFKYFLFGGRDNNYSTCKVLPVQQAIEKDKDEGTPSCTPENSDKISSNENEQPENSSGGSHEVTELQLPHENRLKVKRVQEKNHHFYSAAVVPFQDNIESDDSFNAVPVQKVNIKPTKTILGVNAKMLRDLLGPNGVCINLTKLSEESARELLKIKWHMKTVLDPTDRMNFFGRRYFNTLELYKIFTRVNAENLHTKVDEELPKVKNLKDFLKIVINFYKAVGVKVFIEDCTRAILSSGIFHTRELLKVFQKSIDQIFQFACSNRINHLAIKLVRKNKYSKQLNLYEGIRKAFDDGNQKLGRELLSIVGNKYGKGPGSVYRDVHYDLELEEIEE